MATATNTTRPAPRDEKVYHPLDRVRGIIRRYILVEGVLSVVLFFIAWFTIALALDYGLFKAFAWDWVQDGGWWLRLGALVLAVTLLGMYFVFRIVRRLTTEFSYPALALVLERRFPEVLGDRLITAVELADVDDAAKYGYSKEMIRATIDEARERVGRVDVNEAFNWRRLRVMAALVVVSVVGLAFIGFMSHALAAGQIQPAHAAWKSYHVASIVVERDLLLMDTPWPRQALLELQGIDEKGVRTPRDSGKAHVRVRAYRWVVADRSRHDGWRPLMWSEVNEQFVGMPVPGLGTSASGTGGSPQLVKPDATADEVLENPALVGAVKTVLGGEKGEQFQAVIQKLEAMATDPANGRRFRRLDDPGEVTYRYTGVKGAGDGALKAEGSSEYGGDITGLKEDVLFRVRARDFRTPQRPIVLVPPPGLLSLRKTEFQPAYRHYAAPKVPSGPGGELVTGGYAELAGLRQRMVEENLTLTGQLSHFSVPIGTELVIVGTTEKPITSARAIPQGNSRIPGGKFEVKDGQIRFSNEPVPLVVGKVEEADGDRKVERGTFTYAFRGDDRITSKEAVQFEIEFTNEDGLTSRRQIQINVLDDNPPLAEVLPDVIRRVNKHFWVTPRAKIPFNPESRVKDEIGLSKVAYAISLKPADAETIQQARAEFFARKLVPTAAAGELGGVASSFLTYAMQVRSDQANARREASFMLGGFVERDKGLEPSRQPISLIKGELLDRAKVPSAAQQATSVTEVPLKREEPVMGVRDENGTFHKYLWEVRGDFFDIGRIETEPGKKLATADEIQRRYEMQLYLEATDTNFDTGPRASRSEPIDLMIVSDSDLLVEIGRDELKLAAKLDDALRKLQLAKSQYEFVRQKAEFHQPSELVDAVRVRAKSALQEVAKARELVDGVMRDFRRIELECVYNQLAPANIALYGRFANRGDRLLGENPRTVSEEEERALAEITPRSTFPLTEKSMGGAQAAFDRDEWAGPSEVNLAYSQLSQLETEVQRYRDAIGEAQDKERLKNSLRALIERQDRIARAIGEAKRLWEDEQLGTTPKLAPVGQTLLAKGETKKIRQGVQWRQFRGDEITIKVASSDPAAVVVPAELKLDFERNSLDFEYEIRAGNKEGDYKITLTPNQGDPMVIQVQVK